ncbi:hypothetical protein [Polaromonas sp. DSR2-3-2]|uniref:hypothetical protein n=1 Tax=unclassified Polaromonas TaxID=2638319 RepID=UPI003CF54287
MQPHVAHVGAARAAAEVLAQGKSQVNGHRHMPVLGASQGEQFAADVFMALGLRWLLRQVVDGGKKRFLCGVSHDGVHCVNR